MIRPFGIAETGRERGCSHHPDYRGGGRDGELMGDYALADEVTTHERNATAWSRSYDNNLEQIVRWPERFRPYIVGASAASLLNSSGV